MIRTAVAMGREPVSVGADGVEASLRSEDTVADRLRWWLQRRPDGDCLLSPQTTRTWAQTYERCCRLANGLVESGVRPGDRVLFLGRNRVEFFELVFAASLCRAVVAAVNWRLTSAEIARTAVHSAAAFAFVDNDFLACSQDWPNLRADRIVAFEAAERAGATAVDGAVDFEEWLSRFAATTPGRRAEAGDELIQMYTSGTTGLPKAATFSHRAVIAGARNAGLLGVDVDTVALVAMPVFHAVGSSYGLTALCSGASIVVASRADPVLLTKLIASYRVTTTSLVPEVFKQLVANADATRQDLTSLRRIVYAGSPMPASLIELALDHLGCDLAQVYGMTETGGVTILTADDHRDLAHPERLSSVGRAMPDVAIRIVDPITGVAVPDGEFGEIWARSETVMNGYWRDPATTAAAMTPDGFVRTGDGAVRVDGYVYLRDRLKDIVVTGGENVYSTEVENALRLHPGIDDVAVIGLESARWGEMVTAVVVRAQSAAGLSESDVMAHGRSVLAAYKSPKAVFFVPDLPRSATGKILKNVLRGRYDDGGEPIVPTGETGPARPSPREQH